jgi:hypothetical protein
MVLTSASKELLFAIDLFVNPGQADIAKLPAQGVATKSIWSGVGKTIAVFSLMRSVLICTPRLNVLIGLEKHFKFMQFGVNSYDTHRRIDFPVGFVRNTKGLIKYSWK